MGKILLFYKYVGIKYPTKALKWLKKLCKNLGLKGRILLGHEGINGTLGGSIEHCDIFKHCMENHELFQGIDYKESTGSADDFSRMQITIKKEIVTLGLDPKKITPKNSGIHLTPEETHTLLQKKDKNIVLLDARNDYEWKVGTFEGAIKPNIKNFREFPQYIDEHAQDFAGKEVLMFCTGGIRCERASTYVRNKTKAKKVYQMQGGIHRYAEKYPDGFFRGKNYVFDKRITVKVNDDVLSECTLCNKQNDDYTNCANVLCNKHFICCLDCAKEYLFTCSQQCKELVASNQVPVRKEQLNTYPKEDNA